VYGLGLGRRWCVICPSFGTGGDACKKLPALCYGELRRNQDVVTELTLLLWKKEIVSPEEKMKLNKGTRKIITVLLWGKRLGEE